MARKNVPASTVRNFLLTDEGQKGLKALNEADPKVTTHVGTRGRIHPAHIALFHKANKSMRYETASEAEKPTVTFKYSTTNVKGANITKSATLTTAEARTLLGHEAGRKGRFDMAALVAAYEDQVNGTSVAAAV